MFFKGLLTLMTFFDSPEYFSQILTLYAYRYINIDLGDFCGSTDPEIFSINLADARLIEKKADASSS